MSKLTHGARKEKAKRCQRYVAQKVAELTGLECGKDCPVESRQMGETGPDVRLDAEARKRFPFTTECKNRRYKMSENEKIYGILVSLNSNGWKEMEQPNYLIKLSQEHGTLKVSEEIFDKIKIGDLVGIVPVHSCLTANLMKGYLSTNDELIDHL